MPLDDFDVLQSEIFRGGPVHYEIFPRIALMWQASLVFSITDMRHIAPVVLSVLSVGGHR